MRTDADRIAELERALIRYGQHLEACPALAMDGPNAPYPCRCGLDDLLNSYGGIQIKERMFSRRIVMVATANT